MNFVSFLAYGQSIVMTLLMVVALAAAAISLLHAALQRPDAFTAVDKQTKVIWVAILAVACLFILLFGAVSLLGIIAVVAVGVYLADVRPRVDSIQGKSWFKKA